MKLDPSAIWPDGPSELLLQAALDPSPSALNAFIGWKSARGLTQYSEVDFATTRLLPLIYRNLTVQGLVDPWLPQMSGLCRYHWMRNAAVERHLREVLKSLAVRDVPCVVLGGLALMAAGYLDDLGERPALEGEILISPENAPQVRKLLASFGWLPERTLPPVPGWRGESWNGPEYATLEIHYHWLPKPYPVLGAQRLLKFARPVERWGVTLQIPDPADQLLHACICSRRITSHRSPPIVWAADAHRILVRSGTTIDWDRLCKESQLLRTRHALLESLDYLQRRFAALVPEDWLIQMRQGEISREETRLLWRACRQPTGLSWASLGDWVRQPWQNYVAAERSANRELSVGGFIYFWRWHASREISRHIRPRSRRKDSSTPLPQSGSRAA